MKLSIIIPCLNEEKYIEKCINSILLNDYPKENYEIIVVDGGSTDRTLKILNKIQLSKINVPIKVFHNPKKIPPSAMNIGIKHSEGELIMRLDSHAYYPSNYISELVKWKNKLNAGNVGAPTKTEVLNVTKTSIAIKKVLSHRFGLGGGLFRLGADEVSEVDTVPFGCYSKKTLIECGKYDERLKRNQDIELNKRFISKGKKVYLIPYTFCVYYAREKWGKLAKNNFENGKWNLITTYYTKTFSSLSIRHFIPLIFFLSLVIPVLLSIFFFPFIFISLISLTVYLVVVFYITSKVNKKNTSFLHVFWTFIVLHLSYGIGSFLGLFHFGKLFSDEK